jgi:hypothetical protein
VAISPDGSRMAFVLLDSFGNPTNEISFIELEDGSARTVRLLAPATDRVVQDSVRFADVMEFLPDGRTLVYDAFTEVTTESGSRIGGWALYSFGLDNNAFQTLIQVEPGLDFGNPSLGRSRNHLITFEVIDADTGMSSVLTGDLASGDLAFIGDPGLAGSLAYPGFNGDESLLIYSHYNPGVPSFFSLAYQPLEADGVNPVGDPDWWMQDADSGVIYRRGLFKAENRPPQITLVQPADGLRVEPGQAVSFQVDASDPDGTVTRVEYWVGSTRLGETSQPPHRFTWNLPPNGLHRVMARAVDNLGAIADTPFVTVNVGMELPPIVQSATTVDGEYSALPAAEVDVVSRTITLPLPSSTRFYRLLSSPNRRIVGLQPVQDLLRMQYE